MAMLVVAAGTIGMLGACARGSARATGGESASVPPNQARGKAIFAAQCEVCHGVAGVGGAIGPSLRGERTRRALRAVTAIIENPSPPMPELYPGNLSERDVRDVAAYVESL